MSLNERQRYDEIEAFLSETPHPMKGVDFIKPVTIFGRSMLRYFDDEFPYSIYYDVDEDELTILLVLRSATRKTPL